MSVIVCINDFHFKREYFQIINDYNILPLNNLKEALKTSKTLKRWKIEIDGLTASYLIRELREFSGLRKWLCTNPALRGLQLFWINIIPSSQDIIDYKWNEMLRQKLWEKIEMDHIMSWLSTLGGGYSALGEQFEKCALTAGQISLKQLEIGMRLEDPFLQSRCILYYSISLIQTGKLRKAKHIVRKQYKFALEHKEYDPRLVKMCEGIWLRIQYEYGLRLSKGKDCDYK